MSQFDWGVMDPNAKGGTGLALDLNKFRDALNTLHRGANRPPYAQPGMAWLKEVSSERWELTVFDGSVDLMLRAFNPTTSSLIPLEFSEIEGLADALSKAVQKDAATTTGAALIPGGSSAQRPSTPVVGMLRFNADLSEFERYQGGKWLPLNAMDKALNEAPIVTLASAATVNIGAVPANTISITGAITINAFDTIAAGVTRRLVFQGGPTLTHNASSLILPGAANITAAAGDVAEFVSLGGGNWRCVSYQIASISPVRGGYVHVRDEKSSGTNGGTFTSGAWRTRDLNTVVGNTISGAALSSNQLTLPPGTYEVDATAPHFQTGSATANRARARLYDITGAAVLATGTLSGINGSGAAANISSFVKGRFTLAVTSVVELQHRSTATVSGSGFGDSCAFGDNEVYSDVFIRRVG